MGTHGGKGKRRIMIENGAGKHKLMRLREAQKHYSISYRTLRGYAEQAGAWKKNGKIVYVDTVILDRFLSKANIADACDDLIEQKIEDIDCADGVCAAVSMNVLTAYEFHELTYRQRLLLIVAMVECAAYKNGVYRKNNELDTENGEFYLLFGNVSSYGMYKTDDTGFKFDRRTLVEHGFLEVVKLGGANGEGGRSVYKLTPMCATTTQIVNGDGAGEYWKHSYDKAVEMGEKRVRELETANEELTAINREQAEKIRVLEKKAIDTQEELERINHMHDKASESVADARGRLGGYKEELERKNIEINILLNRIMELERR